MDAGDSEVTCKLDTCSALNNGVEVLGGTISINVNEEVRRLDRVIPSTRSSEVVCNGDWWRLFHEIGGHAKAIELAPLTIMGDVDRSARNKDGVNAGIIKASGVRGAVFHL